MANNQGKEWEKKFKESWEIFFPNTFIHRLPDQQSKYKSTSKNPCDFLALPYTKMFMIELKSHKGNTFPFTCFKQYDTLKSYVGVKNTKCCLIVWFIDHKKVLYVPIEEVEKMKLNGLKSINIKMLKTKEYYMIDIPPGLDKGNRKYPMCDFTFIKRESE